MKDAIRSLSNKLLPESAFAKVSSWYRSYKERVRPKLTEEEFRSVLIKQLGLEEGDTLFIHSSLSELSIAFSPARILRILQDVVGPDGTLLFPASHFRNRAEDYLANDPVFDVRNTRTVMGFLPEYVRHQANAHRSLHPTSSVVAIGRHARELTEDHHLDVYPCGVKSPYYRTATRGGKIVGIGIEPHYCLSFVHVVEDVIKDAFPLQTLNEDVHRCRVIDHEGRERIVETLVPNRRIQHRDMKRYFRKHLRENELKVIRYRGSRFFVADASALLQRMEDLAHRGVTIYTREAFADGGN